MKSIAEAHREMLPHFEVLPPVRTPLLSALGQVLAEDLLAAGDLPPFDNSAMDGYAVRHDEVSEGQQLPIVGEARAGGTPPPALRAGTTMRIFTGAPLPEGADTVVMQENAELDGERVRFSSVGERGRHVRPRGHDQRVGEVAVAAGAELGPSELALLAVHGHHTLSVHRAPRVAILSTGDELRDIGQATEPGTIVNSNAYALAAQVVQVGGVPWVLPPARDRVEEIAERVAAALEADVVISIGGVSVGEYDFVGQALARAGVSAHFHKVAIKPGKPILFGSAVDGTPVVGLPGNPVSAMVTFELFVRPGLLRMRGFRAPYPAPIPVVLDAAHRHSTGRTELARVRLEQREGQTFAAPHPLQGSGALPSMVGVDALLVLPGDREYFERGEILHAIPLGPGGRQAEPPIP